MNNIQFRFVSTSLTMDTGDGVTIPITVKQLQYRETVFENEKECWSEWYTVPEIDNDEAAAQDAAEDVVESSPSISDALGM
jgi:hypothetical protein